MLQCFHVGHRTSVHLKTELAVTQLRFQEKVSFDDTLFAAWNGTVLVTFKRLIWHCSVESAFI